MPSATAIAVVMLRRSPSRCCSRINLLQRWAQPHRQCDEPMIGRGSASQARRSRPARPARSDPPWCVALLIAVALASSGLFLVLPLVVVFVEAFAKGVGAYLAALADPDALGRDPPDAAGRGASRCR